MKRFLDFILYSNLFTGICAISLTIHTYFIMGEHIFTVNPFIIATIFFATFLTYNINIFLVEGVGTERTLWRDRNQRLIKILLATSLLGLLTCSFWLSFEILFLFILLGSLSFLYTIPTPLNKTALRQIPYLKIFLIAFVWSSVTILFPLIELKQPLLNNKILLLFLERFIFILSITIPFDIRDYKSDKENKIRTIPGIIGIENSKKLSVILLIFYLLISFLHYNEGVIFTSRLLASLFTAILIFKIKSETKEPFYLGLMDGTMVLQCLLLGILSNY